jgi:1,4-dihydroxy-2-naphthoyl-CoA hydrolase
VIDREQYERDGIFNPDGFDGILGLRITEVSPDRVCAEWTIEREQLQIARLLHGGVHCTVIESIASIGAFLWLNQQTPDSAVVGVNQNTDFLRPASEGTPLSAEATPIHRGSRQQLWQVRVVDGEQLVARGQVRLQNLPGAES